VTALEHVTTGILHPGRPTTVRPGPFSARGMWSWEGQLEDGNGLTVPPEAADDDDSLGYAEVDPPDDHLNTEHRRRCMDSLSVTSLPFVKKSWLCPQGRAG